MKTDSKVLTPLLDDLGKIVRFVSTGKDISQEIKQQKDIRRFQRRLMDVYRLSQELAQINNMDSLCNWPLQQIREQFAYSDSSILLLKDGQLYIRAHYHRNSDDRCNAGQIIIDDNDPVYAVVQSGMPLMIDDVTQRPWNKKIANTRSWVLAPIQTADEIFGVITLQDDKPAAFTSTDSEFLMALAGQLAIGISNLRKKQRIERSVTEFASTLAMAIEARDPYTGHHCERLVDSSVAIGHQLELPTEQLEHLKHAAALHDIGKIAIPDSILLKSTTLSEADWEKIKKHPEVGAELVSRIEHLQPIAQIIKQHQERYDGTGYPLGLKREEILIEARIIAVLDAYDAMTSDRPYRKALPPEEAVKELNRNSKTQFDPQVVKVFTTMLEEKGMTG